MAEARVIIRPDTTRFATELQAQLAAITKKPITIPVTATFAGQPAQVAAFTRAQEQATVATTGLSNALALENLLLSRGAVLLEKSTIDTTAEAAASKTAAAAKTRNIAASRQLAVVQEQAARAAKLLAFAQAEVLGASSPLAAAQVTLTRSSAALAAAQKQLELALRTKNTAAIEAAAGSVRLAKAQESEALTALRAARAQSAHAASLHSIGKAGIASGASLVGLRGAVLTAGAAFLGATVAIEGGIRAIRSAAELETSLNVFQEVTGASADEMLRAGEAARAFGRDLTLPGVTAASATEAILELARAGLSVQESLAAARGTLQLAIAGEIGFAQSADIVASALNSFALAGEEAVRIADLLANSANASQGTLEEMGAALKNVGSVARQVGLSIEDTTALLGILARNGIKGAEGGTVLRVALLRLIAPAKDAQRIIERLGISIRDAQGNVRPDVFAQFAEATAQLSNAQRDAAAAVVFGTRGIRAQAILGREGRAAIEEMNEALARQGAAADLAGARTRGFAGKVENLKNQVGALGLSLGELVSGPLGVVIDALAESAQRVNTLITAFRRLPTEIGPIDLKKIIDIPEDPTELFLRSAFGRPLADVLGKGLQELNRFIGLTDEEVQKLADQFTDFGTETEPSVEEVTKRISELRREIERLRGGRTNIEMLEKAVEELSDRLRANLSPALTATTVNARGFTQSLVDAHDRAQDLISISGALASAMADAATRSQIEPTPPPPAARGLTPKQISERLVGFDALAVQAQIRGDTAGLLAVLRQERIFLEKQLQRAVVRRRPELRRKLESELLATINEIAAIEKAGISEAKKIADELAREQQQAAHDLLQRLSLGREALERAGNRAQDEGRLRAAISIENRLQELIQRQIEIIRQQVADEKVRRAAIHDLRMALIASRNEEEDLRAERLRQAQEQRDTLQELEIQIAEETGNESRLRRALIARIKFLRKQIELADEDKVLRKRLQLELAQRTNDLEELESEQAQMNRAAQKFFFEQLQAQQGFAANLLGNLIPRDQTAGLVGVPAPTTTPLSTGLGQGLGAAIARQEGRLQGGPTAGQAATTNEILRQILAALRALNRGADAPEAHYQRRSGSAAMDIVAM